ncbi:MAG: cysteine--tRNA ligase, partial [Ruminococcus sp.]|nr:cysteine--tRNA ligase [Ruminococcus sp.]
VLHLNTNSGKMSKSKGEFLTVSLLEEKGYKPVVYRFFCLLSHYRKSLVFSWENLDNAVVAYNKLVEKIAPLTKENGGDIDKAEYDRLMKDFTDALDNDINTAMGITVIYDVLKSKANAATKLALIAKFDEVLGLDLIANAKELAENAGSASADIPAEVLELVEQRKAARKDKNFALADELRDKIAALGYEVKETRQGTEINKIQ